MSMRTKYASTRFSIVKRSKGQSAVDAASYISRSVLVSEYDGKTYRPKYHEDLVHCEINLPEYAPEARSPPEYPCVEVAGFRQQVLASAT